MVKGGAYVYGSYPDIDALFAEQAAEIDGAKREAMLHRMQQLVHERSDLRADLAAGLHLNGVGPQGRAIGLRPDHRAMPTRRPTRIVTLKGKT